MTIGRTSPQISKLQQDSIALIPQHTRAGRYRSDLGRRCLTPLAAASSTDAALLPTDTSPDVGDDRPDAALQSSHDIAVSEGTGWPADIAPHVEQSDEEEDDGEQKRLTGKFSVDPGEDEGVTDDSSVVPLPVLGCLCFVGVDTVSSKAAVGFIDLFFVSNLCFMRSAARQ